MISRDWTIETWYLVRYTGNTWIQWDIFKQLIMTLAYKYTMSENLFFHPTSHSMSKMTIIHWFLGAPIFKQSHMVKSPWFAMLAALSWFYCCLSCLAMHYFFHLSGAETRRFAWTFARYLAGSRCTKNKGGPSHRWGWKQGQVFVWYVICWF